MRLAFIVALLLGSAPPDTECTCPAARIVNGWCDQCEVGYVASIEIESSYLFRCLDAHGHETDPKTLECAVCRVAYAGDLYCDEDRVGFVDEMAYFSRLNYELARGKVVEKQPDCARCRANMRRHVAPDQAPQPAADRTEAGDDGATGADPVPTSTTQPATGAPLAGWCDACGVGMIGNVSITEKSDFIRTSLELERLLAAIETSSRCEHCAAAQFFDGVCPLCRIRFEGGQRVDQDQVDDDDDHGHPHPHPHPH